MLSKRIFLFILLAIILQTNICFAQITKEERGDSFKWVMVTNKSNGERGVETPTGKVIVPMGKYMITYQELNGGFFQLQENGIQAAYSTEGKILIPFTRGYDRIVRHGNYYGVRKNGLEGACDDDGYEIVAPKYAGLFYSSIDGFNSIADGEYVPLGITKDANGLFSGVDYSLKSVSLAQTSVGAPTKNISTSASSSQDQSFGAGSSTITYNASGTTYKDQYRRSSLCLILLTHRDKKYAAAMERVFRNFPLPARYNEHNISDIRVISVQGKQSKSDIDRLLSSNNIAQKIVARWFNRNAYTGRMNMDLIHERGGYGAFYADYLRSQSNVRGTAMLRDEGIELLQSTFVLVCDMDYIDKKKGAFWAALGTGVLTIGAATMATINQQQAYNAYYQGNYNEARRKQNAANQWNAGASLGAAATTVVADIGGFRVKMNAYLYKLRWDDSMTQTMYRDYWCDNQTSYSEAKEKKIKFDNALFTLDYVGEYKAKSSKTILRSWNNEDQVILDVCQRCVNKGMKELAKTFPIFKPRTPFYFEGSTVYSHIGTKEEVSYGKKYEIVQPYKDSRGQICYKRVGTAEAGTPWNNREIRFDQYFDNEAKGTIFYCKKKKASVDLHMPGLQLREL